MVALAYIMRLYTPDPRMRRAALTLAALMLALPAQAEEQNERLLYDVMFGGLHVADVVVTMNQSPTGYDSSLAMRTRGVAESFQDFRADMSSQGGFVELRPAPSVHTRAWSSPKVASEMTMRYDPVNGLSQAVERLYHPITGAALSPEDLPWNNRRVPKPVPENLRSGAVDPVAAFIAARRAVLESGQREVRVPIYDGRRRYDIVSTVGKPRTSTIKDITRDVIPVVSKVEPVFGFEPDAEDRMRDSSGTTFFSNDARFIPIQIILSNEMFSSVMNLRAECTADPAPCDAFAQPREQKKSEAK